MRLSRSQRAISFMLVSSLSISFFGFSPFFALFNVFVNLIGVSFGLLFVFLCECLSAGTLNDLHI